MLKIVLPSLISDSQSAFVSGKEITDNILVAYEIIHFLKMTNKGKQRFMSLKLYMSKAYDHVEWNYLECILKVLSFPNPSINLIMQCVKTIFFILINGWPKRPIVPSKGLKQGDPLSPYLFILYTEDLVNLLKQSMLYKSLSRIRVCQWAFTINHLLFAYDSLIFCKANIVTSNNLLRILHVYAQAYG